jgi:energy-coupling factor transporter ATP-binding protein EcfA2
MNNESFPSLRVLVMGDSGVGKTTLLNTICGLAERNRKTKWTLGCNVQVLLFQSVHCAQPIFVELYDVSGSRLYSDTASVFYKCHTYHGVLLVHDLSNRTSFNHLARFLRAAFGHSYGLQSSVTPSLHRASGVGALDSGADDLASSPLSFSIAVDEQSVGGPRILSSRHAQHHGDAGNLLSEPRTLELHDVYPNVKRLPVLIVGNKSDAVHDGDMSSSSSSSGAANSPLAMLESLFGVASSSSSLPTQKSSAAAAENNESSSVSVCALDAHCIDAGTHFHRHMTHFLDQCVLHAPGLLSSLSSSPASSLSSSSSSLLARQSMSMRPPNALIH